MNTIVMNTLNAAVTEYDWAFQSITPTHAGDATGLYALGGDTDNTAPIAASFDTGKTNWGVSLKKGLQPAYLSIHGPGASAGQFHVHCPTVSYAYPLTLHDNGLSRAEPGLGILENYLGFGYSNVAGADFSLDRIEIPLVPSKLRRS